MEPTIFAFLRRYAWKQQVVILALTAFTLPLGYAALELPKLIINRALGTDPSPEFFGYQWDRMELLWTLCGLFLATVLASGGLKYVVNVYAGVVSERMLRRLRYQLYDHVLRFPLPHLKRVSQGELVQMINAEVEPLGGFVGEAVTTPGLQGGTLLISLTFMFVQDPVLGLAATALYPLQIWIIPKLQAKVNQLGKQRVNQVRRNAEKISESAAGVRDIRGNGASNFERARFSSELSKVFNLRFEIYKKKFLIKFLNNFLSQIGPFFFYSIGGYLVIQGQLTVGALVAVIGAQKDITSPWKELLSFYQMVYDVRIKYDQVVTQFMPQGLREPESAEAGPAAPGPDFRKDVRINGLGLQDDDGGVILDSCSANFTLPTTIAIVGSSGSGKEELALCMAGLLDPSSGRVLYGGVDVTELPEFQAGRKIAFVGNPTQIFRGSIRDNMLYGLCNRPVAKSDDPERGAYLLESARAGNSPLFPFDDWTDFASIGIRSDDEKLPRIIEILKLVGLDHDAYSIGLRSSLRQPDDNDLEALLLDARREMRQRLEKDPRLSRLVEPFDLARYNTNATLGENLIFGTTTSDAFDIEHLAGNRYVRSVLDGQNLTDDLIEAGYHLASTMVELFADLSPDHEYYREFSFINAEDLPEYRALVSRADVNHLDHLNEDDRAKLLSLPFKFIVARHRLELIGEELQGKVLKARAAFRKNLPEELKGVIEFFDPDQYNRATTIQDNILFGRVAYGQAQAREKILTLIGDILEKADTRDRIIAVGIRFECGVSGGLLSAPQRQKLGLARALMKEPDVLILVDATGPLDRSEARVVLENVLSSFDNRTVIWALQEPQIAKNFKNVIVMDHGSIAEKGTVASLDHDGSAYHALVGQ
ncbi:MAG: ATP-binding cassette domain-containing protein [Geminicoccaceae bacterium]|nr:ATP-binding cassette domain-containing protein [Geminicoccaceae bacterium]